MVVKKGTIDIIKNIIKNYHNALLISVLGKKALSKNQLRELKKQKINPDSYAATRAFLEVAYNHNLHNEEGHPSMPQTIEAAHTQQGAGVHQGEAHDSAKEHLNSNIEQLIDKQAFGVMSRVEGIIRDSNNDYRFDALQNLNRREALDSVVKKNTVASLKHKLRAASNDSHRDWTRIAATEISNAVGLGSADRIVLDNKTKELSTVYAYRVSVVDGKLCKFCRRFYVDSDGSPKLYRMSTLLSNGSNFGKKSIEWKPTILVTHPNERCSQVLELRPGFKLLPGGRVEFIGLEEWSLYIKRKVQD